jgi:Lon protease-like protein
MSRFPFLPTLQQLPRTLPVFPLPGALVMPGSELPLNIFEPRYLNMVEDALASHHLIGMLQPALAPDARPGTLSRSGCAGRITQYRETADGRIELVLTGACRFDAGEELPTTRGYRLVVPDWSRFAADCDDSADTIAGERERLLDALRAYLESKDLQVDWGRLERLATRRLLNSLACVLPLPNADKQALLETVADADRAVLFTGLLERATADPAGRSRH